MDYEIRPGKKIESIGEVINKEKPIISIITPHYNGKRTAQETANSVFSQTFPFFEWIIVDDGSTDPESLALIKKIAKSDDRIKFFEKENGGPSMARDYGISKMSSETKYVLFLDTDDIMEKNMLEVFYWALETNPDYSFVYTKMINFEGKDFIWEKYLTVEQEKTENLICISSMVRKEDLLEVGGFGIKEKAMYEDWNLWLKLLAAGKKPIRLTAPVFWYRFSNTGELSRAKENHARAMKYVNESAKLVSGNVDVINFPFTRKKTLSPSIMDNIVIPKYKKTNKKTILMVLPWTVKGGADIFNLELMKRVDKEKYNFIVFSTLPIENTMWQEINEVATEYYDLSSFLDRNDYLSFTDYIIKSRNVDIMFVSHSKYGYSFIPYVKSKHPKVAVIDYIHSIDFRDKTGGFAKMSSDFGSFISNTYTCNDFTSDQLRKDYMKNNVETIYIGVDHEKYDIEKYDKRDLKFKYDIPQNKVVISFIARLASEKRPQLFVNIAQEILIRRSDVHFIIAGDGPLFEETKNLINAKNLSNNISMLGMIENPEDIYAMSDLTINCSILEGLALTSYESLSMGVPVVSSDVGGQKELINDSVGRLVKIIEDLSEKEESIIFAEAAIDVLNNLQELNKNARNAIVKKFTLNIMAKKFENIFDNVVPTNTTIDINIANNLYENFVKENSGEFNYLLKMYYEKKFGYDVRNENIEKSERKIIRLKNKYSDVSKKYSISKESSNVFAFLKSILVLGRSFKSFIKAIYSFFINLFKGIFSVIIGFLKYIKIKLRIKKKEESGKILICLEKMDIGGVETFVLNQSIELKKKGFDVYVMAEKGIYSEQLKAYGINFVEMKFNDETINIEKTNIISNFIEINNITQVYINQFPCALSVLGACLLTKTPYIVHLHMSAALLKTDNVFDYYEKQYEIFNDLFPILFKNAYKIVAIVDEIKEYVSERYKIPRSNIDVNRNGLSLNLYKNKESIKKLERFIFISRIDDQKVKSAKLAIDLFSEYSKTNKNITLAIVGSGSKLEELQEYAKTKKININFLGARSDIVKLIESADVVLGMGRCLLEAMAMNRIPILIGYDGLYGLINSKNSEHCSRGNFTGVNMSKLEINDVIDELKTLETNKIQRIIEENHEFVNKKANIVNGMTYISKKEIANVSKKFKVSVNDFYKMMAKYYNKYLLSNNKIEGIVMTKDDYERYTKIISGRIYRLLSKFEKNDRKN